MIARHGALESVSFDKFSLKSNIIAIEIMRIIENT